MNLLPYIPHFCTKLAIFHTEYPKETLTIKHEVREILDGKGKRLENLNSSYE
jgi:hypothetical protein